MKDNTDVQVDNCGSIMAITPITPEGREWIGENCKAESWQWMGPTLCVEPRYAADIVAGLQADGLNVE